MFGKKKQGWDHSRNEPVTETNTREEITALSRQAQEAERTGDRLRAEACHEELNNELGVLRGFWGKRNG